MAAVSINPVLLSAEQAKQIQQNLYPDRGSTGSWMRSLLGLIKFHHKDFIPGSGTARGRVSKLAKPPVSVSHPAEQDSDTCLPTGGISRPLAESHLQGMGVKLFVC